VLATGFGLAVGSFLNVVIYRLPVMLDRDWRAQAREVLEMAAPPPEARFNLSVPRSRCPHCSTDIKVWQNIPVVSWLLLRGRCSACGAAISWRYPAIELLAALATLASVAVFGFTPLGACACVFSYMLIALAGIDLDTTLLPDQMTYPLLWMGLLVNLPDGGLTPLHHAVVGAIAGYLFLWGTYWGFKLITGKEGMGYGDFKLLGALGAWVGWQALPGIVLIAAASGLIFALLRVLTTRHTTAEPIPFGPFLALGGWVALMFHDNVIALVIPTL
jgi:leader peptidase (prepilin peptidase)/N-methyltransferase